MAERSHTFFQKRFVNEFIKVESEELTSLLKITHVVYGKGGNPKFLRMAFEMGAEVLEEQSLFEIVPCKATLSDPNWEADDETFLLQDSSLMFPTADHEIKNEEMSDEVSVLSQQFEVV